MQCHGGIHDPVALPIFEILPASDGLEFAAVARGVIVVAGEATEWIDLLCNAIANVLSLGGYGSSADIFHC